MTASSRSKMDTTPTRSAIALAIHVTEASETTVVQAGGFFLTGTNACKIQRCCGEELTGVAHARVSASLCGELTRHTSHWGPPCPTLANHDARRCPRRADCLCAGRARTSFRSARWHLRWASRPGPIWDALPSRRSVSLKLKETADVGANAFQTNADQVTRTRVTRPL